MKHLIRRCPMCKEVMGIVIAEPGYPWALHEMRLRFSMGLSFERGQSNRYRDPRQPRGTSM